MSAGLKALHVVGRERMKPPHLYPWCLLQIITSGVKTIPTCDVDNSIRAVGKINTAACQRAGARESGQRSSHHGAASPQPDVPPPGGFPIPLFMTAIKYLVIF